MPRISPKLIRQARTYHALLPPLLGPCRDLQSAKNELRWLHEHAVAETGYRIGAKPDHQIPRLLRQLVLKRARGMPLQYVTGNQPFGALEILCRKGVLIPRPETESITRYLCRAILAKYKDGESLNVLDLCSGTGCISLYMHHALAQKYQAVKVLGVDSSPTAVVLANENLKHLTTDFPALQSQASEDILFVKGDIFDLNENYFEGAKVDVLVSNPPYISPRSFNTITERSVRNYEPIEALVPDARSTSQSDEAIGDLFYPRLLQIAKARQPKFVLLEVGDMEQAQRVAKMALKQRIWERCEVWRDWPEQETDLPNRVSLNEQKVRVRGSGNGRAVFLMSEDAQ